MTIPGQTSPVQHQYFKTLLDALCHVRDTQGCIRLLEIGCAYGRSTCAWLNAIEKLNPWNIRDLEYSILDSFHYDTIQNKNFVFNNSNNENPLDTEWYTERIKWTQQEIVQWVINQHPVSPVFKEFIAVDPVQTYGFLPELEEKLSDRPLYNIVFMDGPHGYTEVLNSLKYFGERDTLIMCGDDCFIEQEGVFHAVIDWYKVNHGYKYELYINTNDRFWVLYNEDVLGKIL